ncbi:GNAT family N-acetyltransferase [Sandaracinobacteroides saxicola]|uniref:GNAT family N-acetyltransferase n=1 Tax=Sandaracinobacteroides saxicola TaxID=2759707 RepID=A0A7G5IL34_9SPHN|nr:GNAT family N-acetyltransferase [Sandaracinobacteroides saxicola]QMW24076.1 GNAT family N-acetyltransferase [Sandaracinobacteroides saxicola]
MLRLATPADAPALTALIARSAHDLQLADYGAEALALAIGTVFALDPQLIADGTYFLIEQEGHPVACGGWSFRGRSHGGDGHRPDAHDIIDPATDPARIRAFFVHPDHARQGHGSRILTACEAAAAAAGFTRGLLVATPAGERLYARHGWQVEQRYDHVLPGGMKLPVILMKKTFDN